MSGRAADEPGQTRRSGPVQPPESPPATPQPPVTPAAPAGSPIPEQAAPEHVRCCIAGCGPAGAVLGLLLVRAGVDVLVLEKAPLIGGTTGVSGGMPWVPMNAHMADVGVPDSRDEALEYIRRLTMGREPDAQLGREADPAAMLDERAFDLDGARHTAGG